MTQDNSLSPPPDLSPCSRGIIQAHEAQQQLQQDYIHEIGITTNAAATIPAMNTQTILDAACSISGSSSRPLSTHGRGILRPTALLPATATTINHPPPRPKPLNFGLDHRERTMLECQQSAITAMQGAVSVHISDGDARAMLLAADAARSTSWLNIVDDSDESDSDRCPTILLRLREENNPPPAHCTCSKTDSHDPHRG
jgi:hypothetical protein